jgi:transcriptional regulator of acetoin/glycerol metabolism
LLVEGELVRAIDLSFAPVRGLTPQLDQMSLEDVERVLITKALERYSGNVSLAAQALGLSRSALYRRLQRHGL